MRKQSGDQPSISDSEWVLMREIWARRKMTANELIEVLDSYRNWSPKTIKTLLRRLSDKGVLGYVKSGREYVYHPLIEREEAERHKSRAFVEQVFDGEPAPALATYLNNPTPNKTSTMHRAESKSSNPVEKIVQQKIVEIDRESLDPEGLGELRWNWKNANRACDKHARQWKEAMGFLDPVLKKHPEFLEARMLMRAAAFNAGLKIPLSDRIPPPQSYIGKARKKLESGHPLEAIEILEEKVFVYLPANPKANLVLHEAALALGYVKTARFALEFAVAKNADDKDIHERFARYLQDLGELEKACEVLRRITLIDPADAAAAKAYKDLVATASMSGGALKERDHDGRLRLERSEKMGLTDEQKRSEMLRLVAEYDSGAGGDDGVAETREGLRRASVFARELGEKRLADLEYALELQHFLVEAFPGDPVLISGIDELSVLVSKRQLAEAELAVAEWADEGEEIVLQAELESMRASAAATSLEAAERAAHANPTSGEAQLNLGRAFAGAGKFREAVKPLQLAKKDPRSGNDIEAMSLLAECFMEGNLTDLAEAELTSAIAKLEGEGGKVADLQWKGLQYKLGLIYERVGRPDEAKAIFAEIYGKDSEFEDVESRVWGGG